MPEMLEQGLEFDSSRLEAQVLEDNSDDDTDD